VTHKESGPFAPCLTDDGDAVSILMERDDPESYLLFTNRSMKQFAKILVEALDFDKKNGFEIDWVIDDLDKKGYLGYSFKGWGMSQFVPAKTGNGTFGEFIEDVELTFRENKEDGKKAAWKHDSDNYHMKELWGHCIYHNLLNVCKAKIKPSGKEDVFTFLKNTILREVKRQRGGKIKIFGENYNVDEKKGVRLCNNPLVLAGLCLIWPDEFFNVGGISSMREEEQRNPKIVKRCRGKNCDFVWLETIWDSKTIVAAEIQDGGFTRGTITKNSCYCGKLRLEAWRTDSDAEIMQSLTDELENSGTIKSLDDDDGPWVMTCSTDELLSNRDKDKEPLVGPNNKFDYKRYQNNEVYRYDILSNLLTSIFYGKRDYSGEKYETVINDKGEKIERRNPAYGKILIKKELPLPETDIRLLVDQILLKYRFFERLEIEPSGKLKGVENVSSRSLREAIENYDFKNLVKGRVYTKENGVIHRSSMISEGQYERLKSLEELVQWSSKDRAAKHRLGRKITEIGQFLQWWEDLYPILKKLFASKGQYEEPLRILKDGIKNVKGVNGD
tara:strand:+ start:1688 stop:3361 length:1674 start_codon:yes stop_codon:yes gene_type:complete